METKQRMLQEFDLEMAFTRKALERVPEDRLDWKPRETSMTLGMLASFLALIPSWGRDAVAADGFDVTASEAPPGEAKSRAELLARFDHNVAEARAAIARVSEEALERPWTLRAGEQVFFSEPRWLVYRTYFMNHTVHHRGQLTVYLRLLDASVPAIYNDSADEKGGMFLDTQVAR